MPPIAIGKPAPRFELPDAKGTLFSSDRLRGGPAVIFFYPKDETPGCTVQACGFRDEYEAFVKAGAQVIGISRDGQDSHNGFATKHRLPFTLLTDTDDRVTQLFGVTRSFVLLRGRETFVLDAAGVVRHHLKSLVDPMRHVREALLMVESLATKNGGLNP